MTIQQAIKKAIATDQWFRPIAWKGYGSAMTIMDEAENIYRVPSSRGGYPAHMPNAKDVIGPWEVVSPDVVNQERP